MDKVTAKKLVADIARDKARESLGTIGLPEVIAGDDLTAIRAKIQAIRTKAITYRNAIDACADEAAVDALLASIHFHDVE